MIRVDWDPRSSVESDTAWVLFLKCRSEGRVVYTIQDEERTRVTEFNSCFGNMLVGSVQTAWDTIRENAR